jgi:hypothetical protein
MLQVIRSVAGAYNFCAHGAALAAGHRGAGRASYGEVLGQCEVSGPHHAAAVHKLPSTIPARCSEANTNVGGEGGGSSLGFWLGT